MNAMSDGRVDKYRQTDRQKDEKTHKLTNRKTHCIINVPLPHTSAIITGNVIGFLRA